MWRRLERPIQSSCKRSVRLCNRINVKSFKASDENVRPIFSSPDWEDPRIPTFPTTCRDFVGFNSSSKCNSCDGDVKLGFGTRTWQVSDRYSGFKSSSGRGFMHRAGTYKDAEELEDHAYHESDEDGTQCENGLQKFAEEIAENACHDSEEDESLCLGGLHKDAEEIEEDEHHERDQGGSLGKAGLCKDTEEIEAGECHEFEEDVCDIDEIEGGLPKVAAISAEKEPKHLVTARELLWKRIARVRLNSPQEVMPVIHKWREQGKELRKGFLIAYITRLRKRTRYKHALEISEWMIKEKPFELDSMDYGIRIDLTARIGKMHKAEQLFNQLLPEHKNVLAYSTLLMNYAKRRALKKAEDTFEEMKKLGLLTTFAINQMLNLYQSKGMAEKVPLLLDEAKLAGVEPDIFYYNILMDIEGKAGNIEAMEKILEQAKANSKVKLDAKSQGIIASAYISANMRDKAELALKRMEMGDYIKTPAMYNALLKLYGQFKSAEDVQRIWKLIQKLPRRSNYSVACLLKAFSSLDSYEGAEKAFKDMEQMLQGNTDKCTLSSLKYLKLLDKLYIKYGLDEKIEESKKDVPAPSGPYKFHMAVEAFLKLDDLEKACEALNTRKGSQQTLFDTYILILNKYAEKGDIQNCEKIFEACRRANYSKNINLWHALLEAYMKAGLPAYGFRQRMYADRMFPTSETQKLLDDMNNRDTKSKIL